MHGLTCSIEFYSHRQLFRQQEVRLRQALQEAAVLLQPQQRPARQLLQEVLQKALLPKIHHVVQQPVPCSWPLVTASAVFLKVCGAQAAFHFTQYYVKF